MLQILLHRILLEDLNATLDQLRRMPEEVMLAWGLPAFMRWGKRALICLMQNSSAQR